MSRIILLFSLLFVLACRSSRIEDEDDYSYESDSIYYEEDYYEEAEPDLPYQSSATREFDLIHTKLEVSINWKKKWLNGIAHLTLKPYFYPTTKLILDAKGFNIHRIALVKDGKMSDLTYTYDSLQLKINLDREYKRDESFQVMIDYTAKPDERTEGGSEAITSDKGLYFINPDSSDRGKPTQIWTQGETESSSGWFPTIDKPNERCTQEIFITVREGFEALSNGTLVSKKKNNDGTNTWYWKMDQPHAPYLFMMAIGDYAVVKDKWRNMEVSYYVEPKYEAYARDIFGSTPEMIEFFSTHLGVDYIWPKYSQVVVRDFVSGAMENTTATSFFEYMQRTKRELIDEDYEDIISHELFHHWFGDLVTCESWSNLPLNESFATYAEYLWNEYKHGRIEADEHMENDLQAYLLEAGSKQEPVIRYRYEHRDEMFDRHSYQKGGLILHMLRKLVGDEAFYASLKLYLLDNKFQSVEIHDLRLAFEEVTGQDLNWFFDQWFLSAGHPVLTVDYSYDEFNDETMVMVSQISSSGGDAFRLPVTLEVHRNRSVEEVEILIESTDETFLIPGKPELIIFDSDNVLLAEITEQKEINEWIMQFQRGRLFKHRLRAMENLVTIQEGNPEVETAVFNALLDSSEYLRLYAIDALIAGLDNTEKFIAQLKKMTVSDLSSHVRNAALHRLVALEAPGLMPLFKTAIKDSSYMVAASALTLLSAEDSILGMELAHEFDQEENLDMLIAVADIYGRYGGIEMQPFFENMVSKADNSTVRYAFLTSYGSLLIRFDAGAELDKGLRMIGNLGIDDSDWLVRYNAKTTLDQIRGHLAEKAEATTSMVDREKIEKTLDDIDTLLATIREKETNELLIMLYQMDIQEE